MITVTTVVCLALLSKTSNAMDALTLRKSLSEGVFQEWLNSFQAKETTEIPKEVFRRVMEELYRQRISDLNQITRKKVREVLKDLRLRKYYEHVTQITCRLNGKKPPRMSPEQEEQCSA